MTKQNEIQKRLNLPEISWKASGRGGAVVAGGREAVVAGSNILDDGGNAADAAVATLLALSITDFGQYCIGAEVPFMIYDARRSEVKVLSGIGTAPRSPDAIEWYYAHGIPANGSIMAAPVPAVLSLCFAALQLYGKKTFEDVVTPALALLDAGGQDWYEGLGTTFRKLVETERTTTGNREEKLQVARDRFYQGDIAKELEDWYIKEGGFLRRADLGAYETRVEQPVTVGYRGYTVCKCDTWTQGPILCQALRLLERFDLTEMGHLSADYIHVCAEALKLAFADRDAYYGDPRFADVPMQELLSDAYTDLRWPLIDMLKASNEVRPGDPIGMKALKGRGEYRPGPGGTTTCCVADRWGNLVAATPSGNPPYSIPPNGIAHANRLRSLNTTAGHPNRIEPGKRPRITLTPTIVLKDAKPVLAISVAGGDLQDQTALNLLLNFVEFEMAPADAVTLPRFVTAHHQDSFNPNPDRTAAFKQFANLQVYADVGQDVISELRSRGHDVSTTSEPLATPVMIHVDQETGAFYAAGDPRRQRHAAALSD